MKKLGLFKVIFSILLLSLGIQAYSQSEKSASNLQLTDYKNYDFVPGDQLIFYYDMAGESDAEIPARMLLNSGNAEVQSFQGMKVLVAPIHGEPMMMPAMKEKKYLLEQFTLEMDVLCNGLSESSSGEIRIYFRTAEEVGKGSAIAPVLVRLQAISGDEVQPSYGFEAYREDGSAAGIHSQRFPPAAVDPTQDNWRHIAIYINKNIGKLYIDQHRLSVLNQIEEGQIDMVEIEVYNNSEHPVLFKNFRIGSGGADTYQKVLTEGKIIAYGIQFDVNKVTLRPESMGTINDFVKMMNQDPALSFEIGGHTDSDGSAQLNETLSQARADAVKAEMQRLGIDPNRLNTKGYGASQPVAPNDHSENKARNRRVEFVKL